MRSAEVMSFVPITSFLGILIFIFSDSCDAAFTAQTVIKAETQPVLLFPKTLMSKNSVTSVSGAKVVFLENYQKGLDKLSLGIQVFSVDVSFDDVTGTLLLKGVKNIQDYNYFLSNVYFTHTRSPLSNLLPRTIMWQYELATLNPLNSHYYRAFDSFSDTFANSINTCSLSTMFFESGYLATVTSAEENAFAASTTTAGGWLGGSNSNDPNVWKWVVGEETGRTLYQVSPASSSGFTAWAASMPPTSSTKFGLRMKSDATWEAKDPTTLNVPICEYSMSSTTVSSIKPLFAVTQVVLGCFFADREQRCPSATCVWLKKQSRCTCLTADPVCNRRTKSHTFTREETETAPDTPWDNSFTPSTSLESTYTFVSKYRDKTPTVPVQRGLITFVFGSTLSSEGGIVRIRMSGDAFRTASSLAGVFTSSNPNVNITIARFRDAFNLELMVTVTGCPNYRNDIVVNVNLNSKNTFGGVQPATSPNPLNIIISRPWKESDYDIETVIVTLLSIMVILLAIGLMALAERAECVLTIQQLHVVIVVALTQCGDDRAVYVFRFAARLLQPLKIQFMDYDDNTSVCFVYVIVCAGVWIIHTILFYTGIFEFQYPTIPFILFWCTMLGTAQAATVSALASATLGVLWFLPLILASMIILYRQKSKIQYLPSKSELGDKGVAFLSGMWIGPNFLLCLVDNLRTMTHPYINILSCLYHLVLVYFIVGQSTQECALLFYTAAGLSCMLVLLLAFTRPYRSKLLNFWNILISLSFAIMFLLVALRMQCPAVPDNDASPAWLVVVIALLLMKQLTLACTKVVMRQHVPPQPPPQLQRKGSARSPGGKRSNPSSPKKKKQTPSDSPQKLLSSTTINESMNMSAQSRDMQSPPPPPLRQDRSIPTSTSTVKLLSYVDKVTPETLFTDMNARQKELENKQDTTYPEDINMMKDPDPTHIAGGGPGVKSVGILSALKLTRPVSIVVDTEGRFLYVSERSIIWALDLTRGLVSSIQCRDVIGIAPDPANGRNLLYVESSDNSIWRSETHWEGKESNAQQLYQAGTLGHGCGGIALTADRRAYISDPSNDRIVCVDYGRQHHRAILSDVKLPMGVALDSVTSTLFFIERVTRRVFAYDLHNEYLRAVFDILEYAPIAITFVYDRLYVCDGNYGSLFELNRTYGMKEMGVVVTPLALASDPKFLYYLENDVEQGRGWSVFRVPHNVYCECTIMCDECGNNM